MMAAAAADTDANRAASPLRAAHRLARERVKANKRGPAK